MWKLLYILLLPHYTIEEKTSTGPYRSCAALLDILNPLRYLDEFGLVEVGLVDLGIFYVVYGS